MTNVHPLKAEADRIQAESFDEFWRHFPRRVGKALARVKWTAITGPGLETKTLDRDSNSYVPLTLKATPAELVQAAKSYRNSLLDSNYQWKIEERFIPHPATWLNKGRFEDEL